MTNPYKYTDEQGEHLHSLDEKPLIGTSTVTKVLAKELTWWASGMALAIFGWVTGKKKINGRYVVVNTPEQRLAAATKGLTMVHGIKDPKEYQKLLDEAYRAHDTKKKSSAKTGTDRHEELETYIKNCIATNDGKPIHAAHPDTTVQQFIQWAVGNIKRFLWSELHMYSRVMWTGGIGDVGWEMLDGRIVAGDFKSAREAYIDHFIQIAGYDLELSENGGFDKDGEKIFELPRPVDAYCVVPFGKDVFMPEFVYDTEGMKQAFKACLAIHKLKESFKTN